MIEMSVQEHDGLEYEIVDRRARSTLSYLLDGIATTYGVSTEFSFVSSSNDLLMVLAGKPYETTLSAYEGYVLDPASVKVTMAGVNVTGLYYVDGVLSIPAVTGDLTITASATLIEEGEEPDEPDDGEDEEEPTTYWTVEKRLYNTELGSAADTVKDGEGYVSTVSPLPGYEMVSVIVAMGGVNVTEDIYRDGVITIPTVTANVIITASAKLISVDPTVYYAVSGTLSNCSLDPSLDEVYLVAEGKGYSTILKADDGFVFGDGGITISMEGEASGDFTSLYLKDRVYEDGLLKQATVNISGVYGNVSIKATASITHAVSCPEVEHVTVSNQAVKVVSGSRYTVTLTPDDGYSLVDVKVTVDGGDVTANCYTVDGFGVGTIDIYPVLGDVEITYEAATNEVETYRVEHEFTNVYASVAAGNVPAGSSYYANVYALPDYKLTSVTVTMEGTLDEDAQDYYEGGDFSGAVTIPAVTGNVKITAVAVLVCDVTVTVDDHVTYLNYAESITADTAEGYSNTFYLEAGYTFGTVAVKIGGEVMTGFFTTYSSYAELKIPAEYLTGDIEITVTAAGISYPVVNTLDGVKTSNDTTTAIGGESFTAELSSDEGTLLSVTVKMGGTDVTSQYFTLTTDNSGTVYIPKVTGWIGINASAI